MLRSGFLFSLLVASVAAQPAADSLQLERVASGLTRPLWMTQAPGDDAFFVVEQRDAAGVGRIQVIDPSSGTVRNTPFLEVSDVTTGSEEGLLGLAFHPDYASNGRFYIYYTTTDPAVNPVDPHRISRLEAYTVSEEDQEVADPASAETILAMPQPFGNHNGGWIGFGPDNYLYLSSGDGGSGNDPRNAAQSLADDPSTRDGHEALLGKLLRIDVHGDDFPDEPHHNYSIPPDNPLVDEGGHPAIWAYGLRNAWRPSFDRETGDLWIADVGQSGWEEINFQAASSDGGENYGWRVREGDHPNPAVPDDPDLQPRVDPVWEYAYGTDGGRSITGGYVYRGDAMPWLQGTYFYADFIGAFVRSFRLEGGDPVEHQDWTAALAASLPEGQSLDQVASFAEDAAGELYLIDLGGEIFRVVPSSYDYPTWQSHFFTDEEIAQTVASPEADPDGDGANNAHEFVFGGHPRERDGPHDAEVETVSVEGDRYFVSQWELSAAAPNSYTLTPEASHDLGNNYTTDGLEVIKSGPTHYRVRDNTPVDDGRRFLRLRIEIAE